MPKRSQVDDEFRQHVCALIDAYITDHDLTDVDAAKVLGVRKQMIRPYRQRKTLPGTEAIARACIHWNLSFSYQGIEISAKSFAPQNGHFRAVPHQLQLPLDEPIEFQGTSKRVRDVHLIVRLEQVS